MYAVNTILIQGVIMRTITGSNNLSEDHWLKQFQEALTSEDLSSVSVRGYLYDLNNFRNWIIEVHGREVALGKISSADLAAYRQYLVDVKGMKAASANRRIQAVKKLFLWAHTRGLIGENPSKHLRFMKPNTRYSPKGLRDKELHALLRVAGQSPHGLGKRNYALIQLMVQTGLRVSEAANVKMADLTIHERSGSIWISGTRGLTERKVPLNATVRRAITAYFKKSRDRSPEDHLFLTKRDRPASIRTLQNTIASVARKAKISRVQVSANTLRHTFVHNYLKAHPGELEALAELLGHASVSTVTVYTRPEEDTDERG